MTEKIRVLLADDHPLFRDGLRGMLEAAGDFDVLGEATTGEEAVALAGTLRPDVVLMDIKMPGINGIEATRRTIEADPDIRILMLTMLEDDDSLFAALRAGARGYLLKGARQDEALRAIRAVANGQAIFGPRIAQRLAQYFAVPRRTAGPVAFPELTDREREILDLIAQGRTNAEIADLLVVSLKTVRNHVSTIFNKLQVADRAQAMDMARRKGLG
ncbi:MAG: response regulator transcription factor [Anaerolineae bacterium]|nr:response regulator transcription factor [Anaerolineae bacterium]MCB0232528.1 response regulator transcription factor [Anaerolineae bacterium]